MHKEALTPEVLTLMVQRRLCWVPALKAAIEQDAGFAIRVGPLRAHERDHQGRNWNIESFATGFVHWPQCYDEFRMIVDRLRGEYDVSDAATA